MQRVGPQIRSNPCGDDDGNVNGVHPLLVDLVMQKVFSFSDVQELLAARRVCRLWSPLATQELRSRGEMVARIRSADNSDEASMTDFIQVMTPALQSEAGMPLTRIDLSVDFLLVALPTTQLLRFVAPWIQGIRLHWLCSESISSSHQVSQVIHTLEGGLEGLSFPALRQLALGNDLDLYSTKRLHFAAMILVKGLISGARGLTSYDHAFRFAVHDARQDKLTCDVIRALPPSLKKLGFWQGSSDSFGVPTNCHFQLEEYLHWKDRETHLSSMHDILSFLLCQVGTLRKLQLSFLDHLYHTTYPAFPMFPLVTRLRTKVSRRSRFDWIGNFPALHHLELDHRYVDESIDPPIINNLEDIRLLLQHQGVRSLSIRPQRRVATVEFNILRHVFPNLAVLHLTVSICLEGVVAQLCTHMTELEVLKLTWEMHRGGDFALVHPDLEAILCGLPLRVVQGEQVTDLPVFGLANLKKLKRLDVSGASVHFELIFTPATLFHAFRRMGELKEIRLNELQPQAVEVVSDIIQALRTDGIEVSVKEVLCND